MKTSIFSLKIILPIILVSIIMVIPSIINGPVFTDGFFHSILAKNFSEQFWSGDFYPTWLQNISYGCGNAYMYVYNNLPYYLPALFYFLNDVGEFKGSIPISLSYLTILILSGVSFYIWLRPLTNNISALLGSIIYISSPFISFYMHKAGLYTYTYTLFIIPLLLHYSRLIADGSHRAVIIYAFLQAALFFSNSAAVIVISGLPILYFLFIVDKTLLRKRLPLLLSAIICGALLSSVHLLTLATEINNLQLSNNSWSGKYNYASNFIRINLLEEISETMLVDTINIFFLILVAIIAVSAIYMLFHFRKRKALDIKFWTIITLISIFMLFPISKIIWEIVPIIQKIQFPWRFLLITNIAFSATLTYYIFRASSNKQHLSRALWNIGTSCIILSSLSLYVLSHPPEEHSELKALYNKNYNNNYPVILAIYTKWINEEQLLKEDGISKFAPLCSIKASITNGLGEVLVNKWDLKHIEIETNNSTDITVQIAQFYYPHWKATNINAQNEYKITPSEGSGLIKISIPKGKHHIAITLEKSLYEKIGAAISALTFIFLFIFFIHLKRKTNKKNHT